MNKRIIIPIIAAAIGILSGYIMFGGEKNEKVETQDADQIWSCAMHPQIRKIEFGDCPMCGMDLIPLEGSSSNPLVFEMSEEAMRIANIQTTRIGGGDQQQESLTLSGKIKSDETTASSLVTHIPGRIEKLYISFTGESVKKGQRIARMYSGKLISAQRELLEAYKIKDDHPELLEAAKNKLRYWKISNNEIEQIIKDGRIREQFDIYAEHSGVVINRKVSVGNYLTKGGVLFDIQNLNKLWAVFDVYEVNLAQISAGDLIEFRTPSISGETFKGNVNFIDPIIDPKTRTAAVRMELINYNGRFKPDMFIEGELYVSTGKTTNLTVPKSAVLWTGERSVVYVKQPDVAIPSFEFREVTLGNVVGDDYVVLEGLENGDEVVTYGAFVIDASAQLNNNASMMNRNLLTKKSEVSNTPNFGSAISNDFKNHLNRLINSYLSLKDAFVASSKKDVKNELTHLEKMIGSVDMTLVKGDAHMFWMKKHKEMTQAINEMRKQSTVDSKREKLDELSMAIIETAKAFKLDGDSYVVQYCPMANNDQGGYWLSNSEQIRNPYFGDKMLKCGEVKEVLKRATDSHKENLVNNHK